jgi:lipopolysaccharide transport system ATP-binding protein
MSDLAIRAVGLSKSYRIDHQAGGYRTLREALSSLAKRPLRRGGPSHETISALKDVSFEVRRGEALGIIGRNGAGKSTLLKILSRITPPTAGRAEVYGRLGSLLEVGTGFHPELTGRENIFLNGAILGMSRREIAARFDEIVDFAETERFLDTPVKRYSSGMYTRLAFAVAAHLRTDILVVDEVLAVGDAAFQDKCLGKMGEVAGAGRTVLFVSHNMAAISRLCTRAILVDAGMITREGAPEEVVAQYLGAGADGDAGTVDLSGRDRTGRPASLEWADIRDRDGGSRREFTIGEDVVVAFGYRLSEPRQRAKLAMSIRASDGTPIALVSEDDSGFSVGIDHDRWEVAASFRDIRLYPDTYHVSIWLSDASNTEDLDRADDCLTFRMVLGGTRTTRPLTRRVGLVFLTPQWSAAPVGSTAAFMRHGDD